MKMVIYYRINPTFRPSWAIEDERLIVQDMVETHKPVLILEAETVDHAWEVCNRGSGRTDPRLDQKKLRSMAVGDVVITPNAAWEMAPAGWVEVPNIPNLSTLILEL